MVYVYLLIFIACAVAVGFAGVDKKGGFWRAFLLSLFLSPLIGILITLGGAQKNPKGCSHCGNVHNEAEFCGLCGKNDAGELRAGFVPER